MFDLFKKKSRVQKLTLDVTTIEHDIEAIDPKEFIKDIGIVNFEMAGKADLLFIERLIDFIKKQTRS